MPTTKTKKVPSRRKSRKTLPPIMEEYFCALGRTWHVLMRDDPAQQTFQILGNHMLDRLKRNRGIEFSGQDPWQLFRDIIDVFTSLGFHRRVDLGEREGGGYWMLERGESAVGGWTGVTALGLYRIPCPLWSVIRVALSRIGQDVVVEPPKRHPKERLGCYTEFQFETLPRYVRPPATSVSWHKLIRVCFKCHRINDPEDGKWKAHESYYRPRYGLEFTHGLCQPCAVKVNREMDLTTKKRRQPPRP